MLKIIEKDNLMFRKLRENLLAFSSILTIVPLNILYVLLNNSDRGSRSLVTKLDNSMPFIKEFIVPYIIWYAFIFFTLAYLCYKDKETFYITVVSYNLGLIASYITFFLFQTHVPRPELSGNDIFTKLVMIIYGNDQPYNCFPSIHVLTSFLMVKAIMASKCKNKTNLSIIWTLSVLIILSTLFVKQHVILDAVSGIIYADLIFRFASAYSYKVWNFIRKQIHIKGQVAFEENSN